MAKRKKEEGDSGAAPAGSTRSRRAPDIATDTAPTTPRDPGDAADQAQQSESMVMQPTEEEIRRRAYQRFLDRGGEHGQHLVDWVEAEKELRRKKDR